MPSVGNLNASLTATDKGFNAVLNQGAQGVSKIGRTANDTSFVTFNAGVLKSRESLHLFSAATGIGASSLRLLMHSIGAIPLPVLAAAAAFIAIKAAIDASSEALKNQNEEAKKFHDAWKDNDIGSIAKENTRLTQAYLTETESLWAHYFRNIFFGQSQLGDQLESEIRRNTLKYQTLLKSGGLGGPHKMEIETAVKTGELGVFKLEHSAQDPLLAEGKEHTKLLSLIAQALQGMNGVDPIALRPSSLGLEVAY
jgi:hypothetical protein